MRIVFTLLLSFMGLAVFSQDLTGIWRGNFVSADNSKMNDLFNLEDRYKYEVQIDQHGKAFTGVTYSYKTTVFYGKASSSGTVNPTTGKVVLQELKLLELKMASSSYACWMICFLQYTKNGDEEFLEGKYSSYRETDSAACGRGKVFLRKVVTSDFYREPFLAKRDKEKTDKEKTEKKDTLAKHAPSPKSIAAAPHVEKKPAPTTIKKPTTAGPTTKTPPAVAKNTPHKTVPKPGNPTVPRNAEIKPETSIPQADPVTRTPSIKMKDPVIIPPVLKNRENEVVQTLSISSNEVTINIYDNGTIDHDTISVYLDKKLVINHQMLTTNAITLKLKMDESTDYHELVMVADNLGDIPPNTSLMVVKAGDKEYEVRIASTEQKNAVVIFKYEKPR